MVLESPWAKVADKAKVLLDDLRKVLLPVSLEVEEPDPKPLPGRFRETFA